MKIGFVSVSEGSLGPIQCRARPGAVKASLAYDCQFFGSSEVSVATQARRLTSRQLTDPSLSAIAYLARQETRSTGSLSSNAIADSKL